MRTSRALRTAIVRRGVHAALAAALTASCVLPAPRANAQALSDEALVPAMIVTVVAHDLGIPIGLLPFPITQLAGETAQYVGNIGLKAYRPWLRPARSNFTNRRFWPGNDGDGDPCSFHFYLPSSTAEYENLFGIVPIRSPYYDEATNTNYLWQDRWGALTPPRIYHANSKARLSVRSVETVRRYDDDDQAFGDPYYPILDAYSPSVDMPRVLGLLQPYRADLDGELAVEGPQEVYLPIGYHTFEWNAATQLNAITDVIVPGLLLASAVHSEFKTAKGGLKVAKKVKQSGIGDDIVDQADNAADAATAVGGKKKFDSIWQAFITRKEPGPIGKKFVKKLSDKIARSLLCPILEKTILYGVSVLEAETGALLESRGQLSDLERKALDVMHTQVFEAGVPNRTDALKTFVCEGSTAGSDFVKVVVGALLRTFGLDRFVTSDTGVSVLSQTVGVYDDEPPIWDSSQLPTLRLEATDFGGTRRYRAIKQLRASAGTRVTENCGRVPELRDDVPELLPLGPTMVTWTAQDQGPNPSDGQNYAPTTTQTIIVEDTQPPLLLAPPSKVIEAANAVPLEDAEIGDAVAIDLADPQPEVVNDAPPGTEFPLNERRVIRWTATDDSGNAADATQLITVKAQGANTQPIAYPASASTRTAEPVDIRLTAQDFDVLSNIADPLTFKIEAYPAEGEFIAPLLPFFIEDYRTKPGDGLGPGYDPVVHLDLHVYVDNTYCGSGLDAPINFVHEARFVQVTDDGIRYVLDEFFECPPFNESVVTNRRISKWNAAGDFLGQLRLGPNGEDWPLGDTFVLDRDGFLYYNTSLEPGSSSDTLGLWKCDPDFVDTDAASACDAVAQFTSSSAPSVNASRFAYARVDSGGNVVYLADDRSVFAFELLAPGSVRYLGEIGPKDGDTILEDWFGTTPALEVSSQGSLYLADSEHHRIHKLAPITVDTAGELVLGAYIGWSGRCTGSGNKACDEMNERSRGYSCTFEPESCTPTLDQRSTPAERALFLGDGQGQFNTPSYIAIDPNDVLYIADYENERVQRLSPDGSFAGEAVSDGSGINKGERPSFVLGNMGKPESVSVNSSQFYVVDRDEHFVHVFGTLPFKDISDNAATVTYVSDQDFPNPLDSDVDVFTFSVSDGLALSDPASVSVTVSRNFRPPVAIPAHFSTDEDMPLDAIALPADDPDGIIGKDFLGLDTLSYSITAEPEHGALSVIDSAACGVDTPPGACLSYTPDADYYGEDRFRFRVNDGRDDSNEATVIIELIPVNDPPVLQIEVADRVGLGFPTLVTSTFTDDPSEGYEANATWDDGAMDEAGGLVEDMNGDPAIEGVVISEPPMPELEGKTFVQHTYEELGPRTVELCLTDSGGESGCDSVEINVEELVSLGIGGRVYAEALPEDEITQLELDDDESFTYELTIINELPSVGDGLTAVEVVLEATLPDQLSLGPIESTRGTCERDGSTLSCALENLEPGAEVVVTVAALGPGNLMCNEDFDIEWKLTTLSEAIEPEMEFLSSVELISDPPNTDCEVVMEMPDAGVPDGGEMDPGVLNEGGSSGGCSCRISDPSDHDTGVLLLLLAVAAFSWRRRRRTHSPTP